MLIGKNEDNLLEKNKIPDKKSRKIVRKLYSPNPGPLFSPFGRSGKQGIHRNRMARCLLSFVVQYYFFQNVSSVCQKGK